MIKIVGKVGPLTLAPKRALKRPLGARTGVFRGRLPGRARAHLAIHFDHNVWKDQEYSKLMLPEDFARLEYIRKPKSLQSRQIDGKMLYNHKVVCRGQRIFETIYICGWTQ